MKIGLGISLTLHAAAFYMLADISSESNNADAAVKVETLDIDILSEEEFVIWATPVPESHAAPSVPVELTPVDVKPAQVSAIAPPDTTLEIPALPVPKQDMTEVPEYNTSIPEISATLQNVELARNQTDTENVNLGVETGVVEEISLNATLNLDMGKELQLPQAPRVDLTVSPISRPDAVRDETVTAATRPDADPDAETVENVEVSTAPEQSTLRIVTEADRSDEATTPIAQEDAKVDLTKLLARGAPVPRPKGLTFAARQSQDEFSIEKAIIGDVINNLEAGSPPVLLDSSVASVSLTDEEFRIIETKIKSEWNFGVLSSAAQRVVVTLRLNLDEDGYVTRIKLISSSGGQGDAVDKAEEAAKRAIYKGLEDGIGLPKEKYGQWRLIDITFDPEDMRKL